MKREELLEKGKSITKEIYEKMTAVETCDNMIEAIKDLPITFIDENGSLIGLEKVLSEVQLLRIKNQIIETINKNSTAAEKWLEKMSSLIDAEPEKTPKKTTRSTRTAKKAEPEKIDEDIEEENVAVEEQVEEKEEKPKKRKKSTPKVEEKPDLEKKEEEKQPEIEISEKQLAEMYVRDGKTLSEIANEINSDKKSVFAKIEEYNLKEPAGMTESERKTWAKRVMQRYD